MLSKSSYPIMDYDEEKELEVLSEMAIKAKEIDWKPAIIISCAYLKKYGLSKLNSFLTNRKTKLGKKFDNLSLDEIAIFLYTMQQINDKEFTQIQQIQKAKNRIMVPKRSGDNLYFGEKANKNFKNLVDNTIKIIKSLKSDY